MAEFKPIYTTFESVKVRLAGKVTFETSDPSERGRDDRVLSDVFLAQLIVDAETAVEQDLRGRYMIPFQSIKSKTWAGLPDHSRRAIRTIVDTKAVIMILSDSFGAGTHISGEGYISSMQKQYDDLLRRLMGQDLEASEFGEKRFRRTPPLDDLRLAATNIADDGYRGQVLDAGSARHAHTLDFAIGQQSDPSRSILFNRGYRGPR